MYKTAGIYIILCGGALWYFSDFFTPFLAQAASLMMAMISIWILFECHRYFTLKSNDMKISAAHLTRFYIWTAVVFVMAIGIEIIGVKTGHIFGVYEYNQLLWPEIGGVPLAIGFSWINLLLSAASISYGIKRFELTKKPWIMALLIGMLMVIFDVVLEPAAIRLDYWSWSGGDVPVQNYLAWFILGFLFARTGIAFSVFDHGLPGIIRHAYFAQLVYFVLINLG